MDLAKYAKSEESAEKSYSKIKKLTYPCLNPILVETSKVKGNDYNPNKVADPEMKLLETSIAEDGLTMAIVVFYDKEKDVYEIVDGFHRYIILKEVFQAEKIPVVVIDKPIAERMAATVRHNRARGVHKVDLQAEMIRDLTALGWDDYKIAKHLGMTYEEIIRLKQNIGIAKMIKYENYGQAWEDRDES